MWEVVKCIIVQCKKWEFEFMLKVFDELLSVYDESKEGKVFEEVICDIKLFSSKVDFIFDMFIKVDFNWFVGIFMKMI